MLAPSRPTPVVWAFSELAVAVGGAACGAAGEPGDHGYEQVHLHLAESESMDGPQLELGTCAWSWAERRAASGHMQRPGVPQVEVPVGPGERLHARSPVAGGHGVFVGVELAEDGN